MAKRILVVDDDENILSLERTILEQKGFDVTAAGGGAEALKLLGEHAFDLVLLDVMMPEMDGFTLCRKIKRPPIKDIPYLPDRQGRGRGAGRGLRVGGRDVHQQALHRQQAPDHRQHDAGARAS
jgi:DNA-binding response OmpR family regulator